MPCYEPPPTDAELYTHWERELRHNSPTADALCELCASLGASGHPLTPKALEWWEEHKKRDSKRAP